MDVSDPHERDELMHALGIVGAGPKRANVTPPAPSWEGRAVVGDYEINRGKAAVEEARRERIIRHLAQMDDGQLLLAQHFGRVDALAQEVEAR
jgi:hypothetical protein